MQSKMHYLAASFAIHTSNSQSRDVPEGLSAKSSSLGWQFQCHVWRFTKIRRPSMHYRENGNWRQSGREKIQGVGAGGGQGFSRFVDGASVILVM